MRSAIFAGRLATSLAVACVALGVVVACSDDSSDAPNEPQGSHDGGATSGGSEQGRGGSTQPVTNGGSNNEPHDPYDPDRSPSIGGASGDGGDGASHGGAGENDLGGAGAGGEAPCVPGAPTLPTNVPERIAAPVGVTLLRHFHAIGTQNYVCKLVPGQQGADPTFVWTFVGPVADMRNSCGTQVGTHFAAPNSDPPAPEWRYDVDGSSVIGAKVDASPVAGAIPELLLKSAGHGGVGVFKNVTFVQRLQTAGGAMPDAATCDLGHTDEEQDVPYTAEYYFYSGGT